LPLARDEAARKARQEANRNAADVRWTEEDWDKLRAERDAARKS
jgi:hypothetical protein